MLVENVALKHDIIKEKEKTCRGYQKKLYKRVFKI